jgi:hypothetical protein
MRRGFDASVMARKPMQAPARIASRVLLGLGLALLLATAFSLQDGRLPPTECLDEDEFAADPCISSGDSGWLLPGGAFACLLLAGMLRLQYTRGVRTPLSSLFPSVDEEQLRELMFTDDVDAGDEDRLGDAWADLERGLLEQRVGEEE